MDIRGFRSILNIMSVILIMVVSFVIWNSFEDTDAKVLAQSFDDLSISYSLNNFSPVTYNNEINDLSDIEFNVKNSNSFIKSTNVYFKVDNDTNINISDIDLFIDNKKYDLNNSYSDDEYTYYYLMNIELNSYEIKNYNIDIKYNNKISEDDILIIDFITIDSINI